MTKLYEQVIKQINHLKISNKMMLIYLVGGLLPLMIISFYLIGVTRNILIDQSTQEAMRNATRIEERIDEIFKIAFDVSDALYIDNQLKRTALKVYPNELSVIEALKDYTKMQDYMRLYPAIDSIRFYVNNETLLNNSHFIKASELQINAPWYQTGIENNGKVAFVYKYDEISHSYFLSLVRRIKDDMNRHIGVLVINISNREWRKLVAFEPYEIIGIFKDEEVFMSEDFEQLGQKIDEVEKLGQLYDLDQPINDYFENGNHFKVLRNDLLTHTTGSNIRLITIIPIEHFYGFANESVKSSAMMIGVSMMVALVLVFMLTQLLSNKINDFRRNLHKVSLGDFELDNYYQGKDEISALFTDLHKMTDSIQALMASEYESGIQREQLTLRQREVEFKMLSSQIDPHFLYNTLETIRMEALLSNQPNIAQIVKKLASIMRRKLAVTDDEVSLKSELELIEDYLEIQKFRFRERISFEIIKNIDIEGVKILPLLLQPIVENAFLHGLEGVKSQGKITISIDDAAMGYQVTITDNGIGIPDEKLKSIIDRTMGSAQPPNGSIGLNNVVQRVALFYGEPYHVAFVSALGKGTTVVFHLPKLNDSEEAKFVSSNHS